jgi:hypothetical protein
MYAMMSIIIIIIFFFFFFFVTYSVAKLSQAKPSRRMRVCACTLRMREIPCAFKSSGREALS